MFSVFIFNISLHRVSNFLMRIHSFHHFAAVLIAVVALSNPIRVTAQTPPTNTTCCQGLDQKACNDCRIHDKWCHNAGLLNLSDAERQQLKADLKKIHADPKLVVGRETLEKDMESLRQTRRELLLQTDPSIKPVLDKLDHEGTWAQIRSWIHHHLPFGHSHKSCILEKRNAWAKLSEVERQQLRADLKRIHADPKLVAERKTVKYDMKSLHQQAHALLLAADPSIKPLLDKMEQSEKSNCHQHDCIGAKH